MIHPYEQQFLEIYNQQPSNLSHLDKLLRIDKISCLETEKQLSVCLSLDSRWFFVLSVILTQEYSRLIDKLEEFTYIGEIAEKQVERFTEKHTKGRLDLEEQKKVLQYIGMRKELIKYIKEKSK